MTYKLNEGILVNIRKGFFTPTGAKKNLQIKLLPSHSASTFAKADTIMRRA